MDCIDDTMWGMFEDFRSIISDKENEINFEKKDRIQTSSKINGSIIIMMEMNKTNQDVDYQLIHFYKMVV